MQPFGYKLVAAKTEWMANCVRMGFAIHHYESRWGMRGVGWLEGVEALEEIALSNKLPSTALGWLYDAHQANGIRTFAVFRQPKTARWLFEGLENLPSPTKPSTSALSMANHGA